MPPAIPPDSTIASEGALPTTSSNSVMSSERQSKREAVAKMLLAMHEALPSSTHAERQRFLADCKGDADAAIVKLRNYLEWRKLHCDDDLKEDLDSWSYATQLAQSTTAGRDADGKSIDGVDTLKLPCTCFMTEHTDQSTSARNDGGTAVAKSRKYLQFLPARIDTKLASTAVYALALAIYLDHELDRESTETLTLAIDVRSGYGWANIKAVHLLKFVQSTVKHLCELFPMRLERCIVYPVPKIAKSLWTAVHPFLGKDTSTKVCLVSGPAGKSDKVPKKLGELLDKDLIAQFEDRRKSCFTQSATTA